MQVFQRIFLRLGIIIVSLIFVITAEANPDGIVMCEKRGTVAQVMDQLQNKLMHDQVKVFSRIDFSADAKSVNLTLPEEQLLIFGNPRVGTDLLKENPLIGLMLPLKILVWQTAADKVKIAYQKPSLIAQHYQIKQMLPIANKMDSFMEMLVANVCSKK